MSTVSSVHSQLNLGNIQLPDPIVDLDKFTERIKTFALNVAKANFLVKMVLYLRLWNDLVILKRSLFQFEKMIPLLKFETSEEQKFAEIMPQTFILMSGIFIEIAERIDTSAESTNHSIFNYFNGKIITLMEEIAISLESYAEILALASNKDFVSEVKRELDSVSVKSPK